MSARLLRSKIDIALPILQWKCLKWSIRNKLCGQGLLQNSVMDILLFDVDRCTIILVSLRQMVLPVRFLHNSREDTSLLELVGLWVGGLRSAAERAHFYDYWLLKNGRKDLLDVANKRVADPNARHHLLSDDTWGARVLSYVPGKKAEGVTAVTPVDKGIFHVASRPASNFRSLRTMQDPVLNGTGEIIFVNEPDLKIPTDIEYDNRFKPGIRALLRRTCFWKSQGFYPTAFVAKEGGTHETTFSGERPVRDDELTEIAASWRLRKEPETGSTAPEALASPADLVEEEPRIEEKEAEEILQLHNEWRGYNGGPFFHDKVSPSSFLATYPFEHARLVHHPIWRSADVEITDEKGNKRLFSTPFENSYQMIRNPATNQVYCHYFAKDGFPVTEPLDLEDLHISYKPSPSEPKNYEHDMLVGLAFLCENFEESGEYTVEETADGKRYLSKQSDEVATTYSLPQPGTGADYERAWKKAILRVLDETEDSPKLSQWKSWRRQCLMLSDRDEELSNLDLSILFETTTSEDAGCSSAASETDG